MCSPSTGFTSTVKKPPCRIRLSGRSWFSVSLDWVVCLSLWTSACLQGLEERLFSPPWSKKSSVLIQADGAAVWCLHGWPVCGSVLFLATDRRLAQWFGCGCKRLSVSTVAPGMYTCTVRPVLDGRGFTTWLQQRLILCHLFKDTPSHLWKISLTWRNALWEKD